MIIKEDIDTITPYLSDGSNLSGSAEKVYLPESAEELSAAVQECGLINTRITVSGGGTGLTGGRIPTGGAIISTERLNSIIDLDEKRRIVRVQAGILLKDLNESLAERNLFYAPNPTEILGSIGGNIATNASGSRTFKYGQTRSHVLALKMALASGELFQLSRGENMITGGRGRLLTPKGHAYDIFTDNITSNNIKNAAGYHLRRDMDMIDLFIGSEGTLAITTEAELKVQVIPEKVISGIVFFSSYSPLFEFTEEVCERSKYNNQMDYRAVRDISARVVEFFDSESLDLLRTKYAHIPKSAIGAIWFEQEVALEDESHVLDKWITKIIKSTDLSEHTWIAQTEKQQQEFTEFRHALPLMINDIIFGNNQQKIGTDTAVPQGEAHGVFVHLKMGLSAMGLRHVIFGHISSNHFHSDIFYQNDDERRKALEFYRLALKKAVAAGGTISAEHGIGKLKREYLPIMYTTAQIDIMKKIKRTLDPSLLLGMGNLFAEL